jgi:hypothetical protein
MNKNIWKMIGEGSRLLILLSAVYLAATGKSAFVGNLLPIVIWVWAVFCCLDIYFYTKEDKFTLHYTPYSLPFSAVFGSFSGALVFLGGMGWVFTCLGLFLIVSYLAMREAFEKRDTKDESKKLPTIRMTLRELMLKQGIGVSPSKAHLIFEQEPGSCVSPCDHIVIPLDQEVEFQIDNEQAKRLFVERNELQ